MFLVFSFSLFLFAHYLMKFCVWAAPAPLPHSSSSPGWTTFSTRLATSWIAVDTFCLLSSIFQIDWLRLLLLLSEQENNSKILCKYFVCIFHLIFNLLSFFMVFLVFLLSPAFVWRFVFVSISDSWRIYGFVAACFSFSFLFRVCGRGTVNGSDFNEFYWLNPYPNEVYIFSCAPAVIYQVEG